MPSLSLKTNIYLLLIISALIFAGFFVSQNKAYAYGECSEYGYMATYDYLTGGCKCMSGYVFGKDLFGNTTCISGSSVCYDKYGYGSKYDSLSGSCGCSYGYVFGKDSIGRTQCITENQSCQNQYGSNAQSAYGGKCECSYGYVIYDGSCTSGNTVCYLKNGINSEYDSLSNSCKCSSGYTLDENNQCVEKQNNVYFTLKEIDTDEKKAIIKSDYDYKYYLISYGSGCYSSSIKRYLNNKIVVNLGTDFDVDTWDKIVLQDDNENCDIRSVERAYSDTTLKPIEPIEDDQSYFYTKTTPIINSQIINNQNSPAINKSEPEKEKTCDVGYALSLNKSKCIRIPEHAHVVESTTDIWQCDEGYKEVNNECALINQETANQQEESINKDNIGENSASELANTSNLESKQNDNTDNNRSNFIAQKVNKLKINIISAFDNILKKLKFW